MTDDQPAVRVCTCNRTMPIDARGLASALGRAAPLEVADALCRKDVGAFRAALGTGSCVVACTQEAPLFRELAAAEGPTAELVFVNVREVAGWSAEAAHATPKIAALLAAAIDAPAPEPTATVTYASTGRVLVIGPGAAAIPWAERLAAAELAVSLLVTDVRDTELPAERAWPTWSGAVRGITGHLGAFEVTWEQTDPIDLDLCTRCGACVRACPESAIGPAFQIDPARCTGHRACVTACGAIGAIDFARTDRLRTETVDLVLDLSAEPVLRMARKPQGYLAPGRDPLEQALAAQSLARLVGEFEKPKYFAYEARICAHSRASRTGCTACIDVCSTGAIRSTGSAVAVDPHLCMGCGGCATVCPTGAMTHLYPRVSDLGTRVRRMLGVYRAAGGKDALLLFHDGGAGRRLVHAPARRGRGLPARVIPIEVHHTASIGLDLMLSAIAHGAAQVMVVAAEDDAAGYVEQTRRQMEHGQTILAALGYAGEHLVAMAPEDARALETALWSLAPATGPARAATFNPQNLKRSTLDFALDHLAREAPTPTERIPLGSGAPWGALAIDRAKCTLCKACVSACPAAALADSAEAPVLRFVERNCVQCGLCVDTCPESAIKLVPRLNLAAEARTAVTLHEDEPFACTRCGTPFATRRIVEAMTARLGSHAMFATGGALARIGMCADCRVIDMMEKKDEMSVFDFPGRKPPR